MNVYVAGEVTGNISAPQGKVEISDTGKVIGDVACKGIIIDENAVFQGQCDMTGIEKNSAEIAKERAAAAKTSEESESKDSQESKEENKDENKEENKEENK